MDNRFLLTRKRIKNIILTVDIEGQLKVSAPIHVKEQRIIDFVNSKSQWIEKQRAKMELKYLANKNLENGNEIMILGEKYIKLVELTKTTSKVEIREKEAVIYLKIGKDELNEDKILAVYQKKLLHSILSERVIIWENITGLKSSSWQIRDMKTRWGSCNFRTRKIWFNLQLATKKIQCIDYIIVHELGHILYPNHGADFKAFQTKYYPNWKEIKKLLNQ